MWDDDQDGTPEDYELQRQLVEELDARAMRLLGPILTALPRVNSTGLRVAGLKIMWRPGIIIDVLTGPHGYGRLRAYTQAYELSDGFIDRQLVTTVVLPRLREAMILDDLADI